MTSMAPAPDSPRGLQRRAYMILGDFLDGDLPAVRWSVCDYEDCARLDGELNIYRLLSDADAVEAFARWARFLGGSPVSRHLEGLGRVSWKLDTTLEGVEVSVFLSVDEAYGLAHPDLPTLPSQGADMFVRRSDGQLDEAVTQCR